MSDTARQLRGVGGAPGIAFGRAFLHHPPAPGNSPANEPAATALARFAAAQEAAAARLNAVAAMQRAAGHESEAGIFEFQALLAEDLELTDKVTELVRDEGQPLHQALDAAIKTLHAGIAALDDDYLRQRAADVTAVGHEIRRALDGGGPSLANVPAGAIIIANDLTPAETVELPAGVAGFATATGGPTGHTAILARSRGIPAVVGLGAAVLDIPADTNLILDGSQSLLLVAPTATEQASYQAHAEAAATTRARQQALLGQPGRLADGHPVGLWANIGQPAEATLALAAGAEGIGLFRTELLFYGQPNAPRSAAPTEAEHYAFYRATLETMGNRPVVIRTLDIGGDKPVSYLDMPAEPNPFLGVRALRLCMRRPALFATQLRALLRAALYGDLWIMLPMVATPADLAWGREQLHAAAAALAAEGVPHRADPPLGIMIETPAAAVTADLLARDAAFFSIGSNDLTQYAMAADRGQAELAARYPHDSTAVLRLIDQAAQAARGAGIPLGVCGELAGVAELAPVLAGLGVNELSMAAAAIPAVKERLAAVTRSEAEALARQALA